MLAYYIALIVNFLAARKKNMAALSVDRSVNVCVL